MNRRGIEWAARIIAILSMLILDDVHEAVFGRPENTPLAVTVYIATAALGNAVSVLFFAHVLKGKLSYDLQRLAFCALSLNSVSWVLFMAQQSPSSVNFLMSVVTYGMFTRVCWVSDHDSDAGGWSDLLRRSFGQGQKFHIKKANS